MYIISNKQMSDTIRFIEEFVKGAGNEFSDTRKQNMIRMAKNLLRELRVRRPIPNQEIKGLELVVLCLIMIIL